MKPVLVFIITLMLLQIQINYCQTVDFDFSKSRAEELDIESITAITEVNVIGPIIISHDDSKAAWYTGSNYKKAIPSVSDLNDPGNLVIYDIYQNKVIKTIPFGKFNNPRPLAWSPDGDLILLSINKKFSVLDWSKENVIDLDVTEHHPRGKAIWDSESLIYLFLSEEDKIGGDSFFTFDLTNLKKKSHSHLAISLEEQYRIINKKYLDNNIYIRKNKNEDLWISNRDGSFEKLLVPFIPNSYTYTKDLSSIFYSVKKNPGVIHIWDQVYLVKLKKRELPQMEFTVNLSNLGFSKQKLNNLSILISKGGVIAGWVHEPKFNPLNNRIIGGEGEYLGQISIISINGNIAKAKVIRERKPLRTGLIVTSWYEKSSRGSGYWTIPDDGWVSLE